MKYEYKTLRKGDFAIDNALEDIGDDGWKMVTAVKEGSVTVFYFIREK